MFMDNWKITAIAVTSSVACSCLTAWLVLRTITNKPFKFPSFTADVSTELDDCKSESLRPASPVRGESKRDPFDPAPRDKYLSWDEYFMAVAFLSAQRSKDPNKQVGACIVSQDNVILGIGYNGFPRGCHDTRLPWAKKAEDDDILKTKYPYVVHAEANALLNKNAASVNGAKVYVTMFPCNECAKLLIQAGIKEVVFHEDKLAAGSRGSELRAMYQASLKLLKLADVKLRQYVLQKHIILNVNSPE